MNNIKLFSNESLKLKVRTILNADVSISINAEDTAIGFGWTFIATSGNEVVRWNRVNDYCKELGFDNKLSKDDYIPESLFYMLGMKANNKVALEFQKWLAIDVLPAIRKTGTYTLNEQKTQVPFDEVIKAVSVIAGDLKVNEASKLLMYEKTCNSYGVATEFLPKYENNGSREIRPATELLKRIGASIKTATFNQLLIKNGFLEERSRKSTKSSELRYFKALTEKGLQYGENLISPKNQRETQPYYFVDSFEELYSLVAEKGGVLA